MAVAQPGSRAGLITALVTFVILFFVAAIFAVIEHANYGKADARATELQSQMDKVIKRPEQAQPEFQEIQQLSTQGDNRGRSAWDILSKQRNELATALVGSSAGAREAVDTASKTVSEANKKLQSATVSVPGGSMVSAVNTLADAVVQKQAEIEKLNAQLAETNKKVSELANTYNGAREEHKKALDAANAKSQAAQTDLATYQKSKDETVGQIEKNLVTEIEKGRKTAEELSNKLAATQQQLMDASKKLAAAVQQIERIRPKNLADSIIRKPDGKIIQISRNNTVYINLGSGQQVTPGMTFQIYDRFEGIPPTVDNVTPIDELPPGKGSLEIVRVGADSSECRIIRMYNGSTPVEGDFVANLVYEPGTKFQFKVYGDFDTDHNNIATANEAEIVKRLIVQWGGALTENINIDTDFVVLGKEPVVPDKPPEDDPIRMFEWQQAQKKLADYDAVRGQALELHIPVLNQNRFMYLIGFHDQGRR